MTEPRHLSVVRNEPVYVGTPPLTEARAHLVQTVDDAYELMRWLSNKTKIGFDTETTGLNHDTDRARLVQVGDAMDGWAIPFERWAGVVDDLVRRYEGEYVMHNAPFDWSMMQNGGINIPTHKIHDTRLKAHVLHSTGPLGLKPLAQRYVDPRSAAAQQALETGIGQHGGWTWENVPVDFEPYWVYGALDPVLTFRLDEVLDPQVRLDAPHSYELERAVIWVCERMARKGAKIDREYTARFMDQLSSHAGEVEAWCETYYHLKPGSSDAVADQLLRDGVPLYLRTPGGAWCLDKNVLGPLEHPLAQAVLSRRRAQKVISGYLRHYLADSARDGRVHPSINTVGGNAKDPFESGGAKGVRTGRMSMNDPNLQNVPIRGVMTKRIRNAFVVEDGHTWVKSDADQIEMRIFAHLANDPALLRAFAGDVDVFTAATREIFSEPHVTRDDPRRQRVKNSFYAKLYSAGVEQFALTADIRTPSGELDLPAASAFLGRLDHMYPGIRRLQQSVYEHGARTAREEGEPYVRSPLTQRRHVADAGREYALMNYMIQGAAGEILKMKLIECDQAGLGDFLLFPVHDEIDLEVPDDQLSDALATLHDVVNDQTLLSVPLTWTTGVGKRWGDVEDVA